MSVVHLETQGLSKHFGEVKAVNDLSICLRSSRVHTILGENGCGKSTTLKMLAGVHSPTQGHIIRKGKKVSFKTPLDSRKNQIAIIFQELSLCNNLTVAQNIFANNEPNHYGIIDDRFINKKAQNLLKKYHIPIEASVKVSALSMAQRQLVEIAKGLSYPSEVVIFDEPTSSLSDSEVEILFRIIEELKLEGRAIVYVSHKMAEIMRISDDITVLRDGHHISTVEKKSIDINALIKMMVGRDMNDIYPAKISSSTFEQHSKKNDYPILKVRSLSNPKYFKNISFDIYPGEIVGFFGLIGAGRSEVMNALFGMLAYEGSIEIDKVKLKINSPSLAIKNGIAFITENRKEQGLVLDHSVHINCNLVSFKDLARAGILNRQLESNTTANSIKRLNIKVHDKNQVVDSLSGGNQQKIVFAKWLEKKPNILILDEPTRGVDVGAKFEIYNIIRELSAMGTAVIMVSSELPEVINMSERLLIMREKELVAELNTDGLSQDKVMMFATGAISHA